MVFQQDPRKDKYGHIHNGKSGRCTRGEQTPFLETIGSRLGCLPRKVACSCKQQPKGTTIHNPVPEPRRPPSPWVCFFRKLRPKCVTCNKVQALHPDWLNYDSQSYALNFEDDVVLEAQCRTKSAQMPTISGPGARDIVTALLRRSATANRNCGFHLIPMPVPAPKRASLPLWKRREVQAPRPLDIKSRRQLRE